MLLSESTKFSGLSRKFAWKRFCLETKSGTILNWSQPKFAAKTVANEMRCLKAMLRPALIGRAPIFNLKIFLAIWLESAIQNYHLLYYWPSIRNLISNICPKFQVLSSCFSWVDHLSSWAAQWESSMEQNYGKRKTPIYVLCINKRFAVENAGISCMALRFDLRNLTVTILHAKNWWIIFFAHF